MKKTKLTRSLTAAAAVAALSTGCGADADPEVPAGNPDEPLYVVSTGVISGDEFLGYLATTRSLEAGSTYDLDHAAELDTGSFVFGRPGSSSVYVASLGAPTIVRWDVRGEGDFVQQETLSFANLGIQGAFLAASAPIFSKQKSYFVDDEQDRVIVWNPERMELIGTIELGDEAEGSLLPIPDGTIVVRGNCLVVTVGWRDVDDTTVYADRVRTITIDTRTDEVVDKTDDFRATHAVASGSTSDGTTYFSPYSLYAAYGEGGDGHGAPSVALELAPSGTTFDADYALDLSALVGGRHAGDLVFLDDETALVRAWHPELVDPVDATNWRDVVRGQAGFMWWRWHVGDAEAVEIENQEPGTLGSAIFKVDGRTYSIRYAESQAATALVEITPDGEFVPALEGPGLIVGSGVLRVR